ncbi:MAG: hypothetical protein HQ526_10830 [Actinobacteria bacterium]|nr:hypothetical protein [Actinomycetota bacterium]
MPSEPTKRVSPADAADSAETGDAAIAANAPAMTMRQARMLDLRIYISAMFFIFGTTVTVMGISPSEAQLERAAGVNINLWAGLAMLGLSAVMGVWAFVSPPELPAADSSDPDMPDLP